MIPADDERLSDYEREIAAMRGAGAELSDEEMLACCALGLAEEAAEVHCATKYTGTDEAALAELGDVLWYATTAAHRLDKTTSDICGIETTTGRIVHNDDPDYDYVLEMLVYAGLFAGVVKHWLFKQKPLNEALAATYIAEIVECAERAAKQMGHTLDGARAANLAKLRTRYPLGGHDALKASDGRKDERR